MQTSSRLKTYPLPPTFACIGEERSYRKQHLAAALRLFSRYGFDEGVAGHITVRDPEYLESFWVNPLGVQFGTIKASDLIQVHYTGEVEDQTAIDETMFAIHSHIYAARPDVVAIVYTNSIYGKSWSSFGHLLEPMSQDACAFYQHHSVINEYKGIVLSSEDAKHIAETLAENKALILKDHGFLTVGNTVDEAAWWFILMERMSQAQLLAEAAGKPSLINHDSATLARHQVGSHYTGWFSFQPLYNLIVRQQPELLD
ncbi:MAG: class II aldolase/adducin family protein [Calothrix sp. C42_A2020_038]|nr:class II aldolase/adducin family protein [Calothrix sp. C42_A2020_038]